jgi:hypothetical protein
VIDVSNRTYNTLIDIDCPVSRYSNMQWCGYSEEGQLFTYDSEGIMRCLNPQNMQWIPAIDFRSKVPQNYAHMWIVGVTDGEVLAFELPKGYQAPHMHQKSLIRRFQLKIPFLD